MRCISYCFATTLSIDSFEKLMRGNKLWTQKFHDLLLVQRQDPPAQVFYFSNGTMVCWGLKRKDLKAFVELAKPFAAKLSENPVQDDYSYFLGEKLNIRPHNYFNVDILTLPEDDIETKLALSYAFSQSIKLSAYEQMVEHMIRRYAPIVQELSERGRISLSRKAIKKIIGNILSGKSLVNLSGSYTYLPKFFWQHPNLEQEYVMLERYLDIHKRVASLNQQIDTLSEMFAMLNSYLEDRHSQFLEVIIIALIAMEILISLVNFHF